MKGVNKWKKVLCACAGLLLVPCFFFSQDAELPEALTKTSSIIREKLIDLKIQSECMTLLLEELSHDLEASKSEASQWQERSEKLSASLTSISEQLTSSYETITRYEVRLQRMTTVATILISILALAVVLKALAFALMMKSVKVPRWLDILL